MIIRLTIYLIGLLVFVLPVGCRNNMDAYSGHPNVVFILLDAARADHFSCYGYDKKTTPEMDFIGSRGAIFLKAFAPATETFKSLPRILSSRYLSEEIFQKDTWGWGIRRENSQGVFREFDREQILLPEVLSSNGYRTAIIHDHWWFVPQTALVRSFDEHFKVKTRLRKEPADEAIIGQALDWIRENAAHPFFLYLHIMSPHQPYPPKSVELEFIGDKQESDLDAVRRKFYSKKNESSKDWTSEELDCLRVLYDSNLRHSDTQVGLLYSKLEEWGLAKNTLFIITSDHGENLGQHGKLNHSGPPWDSVTHIPLIMVLPGRIPSLVKVRGQVESIDIMPTIIDICGLNFPADKKMDGISLKSFIANPMTGKEAIYTEESIRTPEYKFIISYNKLYDLIKDPEENKNIEGDNPELKKKLSARHKSFIAPFVKIVESACRTKPLEYPFYLPLREFLLGPETNVQRCHIGKRPASVLSAISPGKSWLLNESVNFGGLFCRYGESETTPVEISIDVPNGTYRVFATVEILGKEKARPESAGLQYRFETEGPFLDPYGVSSAGRNGCYYFDWGNITVKNNRFFVEVFVSPDRSAEFFLHHLRFFPDSGRGVGETTRVKEEEVQERRDGLRSLGYL